MHAGVHILVMSVGRPKRSFFRLEALRDMRTRSLREPCGIGNASCMVRNEANL